MDDGNTISILGGGGEELRFSGKLKFHFFISL